MVVTDTTEPVIKPKRVRRAETAPPEASGGDFNDVMRVAGDVVSSGAKIAAHAAPLLLGLGKKPSEWNELVKKVRAGQGLSLKYTLKYIEENNLYQRKTQERVKKPK